MYFPIGILQSGIASSSFLKASCASLLVSQTASSGSVVVVVVFLVLTRDMLGADGLLRSLLELSRSWLSFCALLRVVITSMCGRRSPWRSLSLRERSMLGLSMPSTGIILFTAGLDVEASGARASTDVLSPLGILVSSNLSNCWRSLLRLSDMLPFFHVFASYSP